MAFLSFFIISVHTGIYSIFNWHNQISNAKLICRNQSIFNIIIRWVVGSMGENTRWPSLWYNSLQKSFQFIFLFFYNFTKIKIKRFECPKSIRNYEKKKNTWNIRRLVNESFGPSTQRPSVLCILKIVGFVK